MTRLSLEKYQAYIYLAAISCGHVFGTVFPGNLGFLEVLLWPILGTLLYATFTQIRLVMGSILLLSHLLFSVCILAHWFNFPVSHGRVLAFSLGTRNSFVVLPIALALPPSFDLAVVAVVFQSLVELFGMVAYL